jgi:hypothetical protein
MSTATIKEDQAYAVERLLSYYLKEGDRVYTMVKHVSSSGMSRDISVLVAKGDRIEDITYYAAHALGWRLVERNGRRAIRVQGCGMDMGFHLVYTLSSVLFRGAVEGDAGYSLKQEAL